MNYNTHRSYTIIMFVRVIFLEQYHSLFRAFGIKLAYIIMFLIFKVFHLFLYLFHSRVIYGTEEDKYNVEGRNKLGTSANHHRVEHWIV